MPQPRRLLAAAGILSLCSLVPAAPAAAQDFGQPSAYGLFLAGRAAVNAGADKAAADYLARAARLSGEGAVKEEAFAAAVMAGDSQGALALAPTARETSPRVYGLVRLVSAVEALARDDGRKAYAILSGPPVEEPNATAATLLRPWAAAAAGDWKVATDDPAITGDRLTYALGTLGRAELLERHREFDKADSALKALASDPEAGALYIAAYGEFLERRDRRADAVALYDRALTAAPDDASFQAARARAKAGLAAPALTSLKSAASSALTDAAAAATLAQHRDAALVYLRLALRLDRDNDAALLSLGDNLAIEGDMAAAREAYGRVSIKSASFVDARTRAVWSYRGEADKSTALALARDTARLAPDSAAAMTTLADLLRMNDRYDESVQVLDRLIAARPASDWRLYYLRALALDKAGRWPDAERDLHSALSLQPDEPELLNYLGYSWIDQGRRLTEALGMVQKAVAADPNSGAVVDSLGWAYFRLGDYGRAVEQLERACQLEPADPDINNHLGDAYWRMGRRVEAGYQWRQVLANMNPDAALRQQIETKLKSGLPPPAGPAKVAAR